MELGEPMQPQVEEKSEPDLVLLRGVSPDRVGPQLQATLNLIPAHTWYANPSGVLTFLNERGSDYLGLPKDHPLRLGVGTGAGWDSHIPLLHPDDHEESRRVWSTCLRTGSAGQMSFRVRNAEGGYRWFLSRAEPVRASDGTLLYWIGVNLDIEDRKQAEFYLAEGQRLAHMGSWAFNAAGFDYTRKIGSSSRKPSRRCLQKVADSTSRNGLCGLMERFVASVAWAFLRLTAGRSTGQG